MEIKNSIIWGDSPDEISGTSPLVSYSNIGQIGYAGTGNIDADPLFVGGPSGTSTGLSYAAATFKTTLTNTAAAFTPGALVGAVLWVGTSPNDKAYYITANDTTTITVWADATLSGTVTAGEVTRTVTVVEGLRSLVHLDFGASTDGDGSELNPCKKLVTAMGYLEANGTIYIHGTMHSAYTGRITQSMTLLALDAPIRIGVSVAKSSAGQLLEEWLRSLEGQGGVSLSSAAPGNTEDGTDGGASAFGQLIYAPVLPFTRTEDGAQSASPDSVLAIRLRAAEGIVPESILATVPEGLEDRASVEWMPAGGDGGNDVWVLFRPEDQWGEGEIFSLSTSASTTADAPLNSATYVFRAGAGDAEAAAPLWQPRAGEDYDATGLDAAYIGFLVRHAAIVQVRGPAE